jgi:hypothetical protein
VAVQSFLEHLAGIAVGLVPGRTLYGLSLRASRTAMKRDAAETRGGRTARRRFDGRAPSPCSTSLM